MGNVIKWADAVKALEVIAEEQKAVSGMSVTEAANALNYTKTASGMYLKSVVTTGAESVAGTTATEVATGAVTEGATTTAVNLSLVEGTGGTAEVVGVGSIALPVAACLAGSVGGYLIGKELNKNPAYSDFFDHLVYNTCDFVTGKHLANELLNEENAPVVPVLFDANGRAYLPSVMLSGVKNYLDTVSTGTNATNTVFASLDELCAYYHITDKAYLPNGYYCFAMIESTYISFFYSPNQFVYNATNKIYFNNAGEVRYNMDGTYVNTWGLSNQSGQFIYSNNTCILYTNENIVNVDGGIHFNKSGSISSIRMPDGITKYTPVTNTGARNLTANGKAWSPVYLPSTSPLTMPDPEPVPETAPDPLRITPYIPPFQPQPNGVPLVIPSTPLPNPVVLPNPEPDASTDPYPASDPASDPSQEPQVNPSPENVPDKIPDPTNTGKPPVSVIPPVIPPSSAKGLLHVYNPTPAQVDQFGQWLWTTFSGDLIDTLAKLFNNPMDAVIGLHELYCTPITSGDTTIKAGFLDSGVASRLVSSRYIEIKCGAISVPEYWGNYLDYAPYTKSYVYLPFIGIVELNTDDVVGSGVEITYRVDSYNGSCIAMITTAKPKSDESVTYQFEGNCSVSVPITSGMMSAIQNALIGVATTALSAGATAAVTAATGGAALPASVMLGGIAAGATKQGLGSKNMVQHSGSFGSSYGAMGIKVPFLIIKRPKQKVVYGYNNNYGYPSHKMVTLSSCSGYLKAIEINVISPTATEVEKKMIEECIKSGVFVS